jgi:hypothetical protein
VPREANRRTYRTEVRLLLCDEGVFLTRNALWTGGRGTGGDLTRHYEKCPQCAAVQAAAQSNGGDQ